MNCLASTGLPVAIWIAFGVLVIGAGFAARYLSRRSARRRSTLLGLVLLLGLGASALATTSAPAAHAASAGACVSAPAATGTSNPPSTAGQPTPTGAPQQTTSPTPPPLSRVDLTVGVKADPTTVANGATTSLDYTVRLDNNGPDATTAPVTLRIPKVRQSTTTPVVTSSNWSIDALSDPSNYVLTYSAAIASTDSSVPCEVIFQWNPFGSSIRLTTTIDAGSAGDSDPTNNAASTIINVGFASITGDPEPTQR